jgi:hypothetical protein
VGGRQTGLAGSGGEKRLDLCKQTREIVAHCLEDLDHIRQQNNGPSSRFAFPPLGGYTGPTRADDPTR